MEFFLNFKKSMFLSFLLSTLVLQAKSFGEDHKNHKMHNHHHHAKREMKTTTSLPEKSIFQLESKWTNQNGEKVLLKNISSQPTIFAMAYTTCDYACPIITSTMLSLEKKLKKSKIDNVHFLLISLDPQKDTPKQLKEYAKKRKMNLKNWTLITSDESSVRELAVVLGINYKRLNSNDIAHSNVIFLMDQNGVVIKKVIGLKTDASILVKEIKNLQK